MGVGEVKGLTIQFSSTEKIINLKGFNYKHKIRISDLEFSL
jgi:hypothetical protein